MNAEADTGIHGRAGRRLVAGIPMLWLGVFFLAPFLIVLKVSFAEAVLGNPPFAPLIQWGGDALMELRLSVDSYRLILEDSLYLDAFANSVKVAAVSSGCL